MATHQRGMAEPPAPDCGMQEAGLDGKVMAWMIAQRRGRGYFLFRVFLFLSVFVFAHLQLGKKLLMLPEMQPWTMQVGDEGLLSKCKSGGCWFPNGEYITPWPPVDHVYLHGHNPNPNPKPNLAGSSASTNISFWPLCGQLEDDRVKAVDNNSYQALSRSVLLDFAPGMETFPASILICLEISNRASNRNVCCNGS